MARKLALATGLFAFTLTHLVQAGPTRLYGYDAWSLGRAGQQAVFGRSATVLYSNPALLVDVAEQFTAGFILLQPSATVQLMSRPENADIPITFYDSDVGIEGQNLDRPLPTAELPTTRADNHQDAAGGYLGIGLVHSLGIDDFRLGLLLLMPASGLLSVKSWYPDERDQYFGNTVHFTRFAEWSQVFSFSLGLAWQPWRQLSLGAAAEGSLLVAATLDAYVPEATVQDYALANMSMDAKLNLRAVIGISARPLDWLRLSLVWRDRRFNKVEADAYLKLWNYHEAGDATKPKLVHQRHLLAIDFEPMEINLAAGVELGAFTAEAGVSWNHWSDYLDPHHQRGQEAAVFEPVNPGDQPVDGSRFTFSDTWSLGAAGAFEYLEGFTVTAGVSYRPTPVPAQVGRTSYADNDMLCAALGHRFAFELFARRLVVDVGLELARLLPATVHKDPALIRDEFADRARTLIGSQPMPEATGLQTNNPGFPGYSFSGWLFAAAATVTYLF